MWRSRSRRRLVRRMQEEDVDDGDNGQTAAATSLPYLPDTVVENILSFLPLKDAVRATAVSKQWKALLPCFPVIDLDEGDPINCEACFKRRRFLDLLRHSLRHCRKQMLLEKLRIRCSFRGFGSDLVRDWVELAIERCVKELDLRDLSENRCYRIRGNVLTLQSLTSLNLENVRVYASSRITKGPVSLPLLKAMSLKDVTFVSRCGFASLLSGCPSIEHLSIDTCRLGY